ncbi:hypothetical protein D3C86_1295070 [compost metagenome]
MDALQLKKMDLIGETPAIPVVIVRSTDGDLVNGLSLVTRPVPAEEEKTQEPVMPDVAQSLPAEKRVVIPEMGALTVQAAHFKFPMARTSQRILSKYYKNVVIVPTKWVYYNIQIKGIKDVEEAKKVIKMIKTIGFPDAYLLKD